MGAPPVTTRGLDFDLRSGVLKPQILLLRHEERDPVELIIQAREVLLVFGDHLVAKSLKVLACRRLTQESDEVRFQGRVSIFGSEMGVFFDALAGNAPERRFVHVKVSDQHSGWMKVADRRRPIPGGQADPS
jgi:hypothetical protein